MTSKVLNVMYIIIVQYMIKRFIFVMNMTCITDILIKSKILDRLCVQKVSPGKEIFLPRADQSFYKVTKKQILFV